MNRKESAQQIKMQEKTDSEIDKNGNKMTIKITTKNNEYKEKMRKIYLKVQKKKISKKG